MRALRRRAAIGRCCVRGHRVFAAHSDGDSCRRCAAATVAMQGRQSQARLQPCGAPSRCGSTKNRAECRVFPLKFHSPPEAPRLVAWSPSTLGGSSQALLVQVPLATLRESLFVSARASARERAQRVPTRAVKDAQGSHGLRSLVRSSPAPRSTPGVYPGAPRAASEKAASDTQPLTDATV